MVGGGSKILLHRHLELEFSVLNFEKRMTWKTLPLVFQSPHVSCQTIYQSLC